MSTHLEQHPRVSFIPLLRDNVENPDRLRRVAIQTLEDSSYGMNNNIVGWRGMSTHLEQKKYPRVSSTPLRRDNVENPDRLRRVAIQTLEDSSYGMNNNIAG